MLLLKTSWGDHLLHNVTYFDCYVSKEKESFIAVLDIDGKTNCLQAFEDEHDSFIFCHGVMSRLEKELMEDSMNVRCEIELTQVCIEATNDILKKGII